MDTTHWLRDVPLSPLNGRRGPGRTKIALVGASAPDGGEHPPLDDPEWDVWGCNSLWNLNMDAQERLRADAWWEMHPLSAQTPQELQDMHDCPVPLYVLDDPKEIASAKEVYHAADYSIRQLQQPPTRWIMYPLEEIRAMFGQRDYFTVTFAYMVALAMWIGYDEIGLYGVELQRGSVRERRLELPCLTYWLGLAIGRGIKITLPEYSNLLWHEHLYGYDYDVDVERSASGDRDIALLWHCDFIKAEKNRLDAKYSLQKIASKGVER